MASITISVVLATFNGERYLEEQLASIARQHRPPDELVVGDDGSSDGTLDMIERFRRSSAFPVTVIHNRHSGVGTNFLTSVEASQGRYIAFADQDDVWLPSKLDRLLAVVQDRKADLVAHGVRSVDERLHPTRTGYPRVHRVVVEDRLQGNVWFPIGGNAMLFDRGLLDGCDWALRPASQWSTGQMNHDDLVKLLAAVRGRTVRIPDRLILYRQHRSNVEGASKTLAQAARTHTDHSDRIRHRIAAASEWARFFAPLAGPDFELETEKYFLDARAQMEARLARLTERPARAVASIGLSVAKGEYSRRRTDGLDWRWALQDLLSVVKGWPAGQAGPARRDD